jgi:two-component SAPR family response regulator
MKSGPIILIEDDHNDEDIFEEILKQLEIPNKLIWFTRADEAFHFLKTGSDHPFIIFCDVNLPGLNGVEFKRKVDDDEELRKKSIPFVFYSTSATQPTVNEVYTKMTVQGFFKKSNNFEHTKDTLKTIFDYWKICKHPNTY